MDSKPEVDRIVHQVIAILHETDSVSFEESFSALTHVFSFQMAMACPDCRKNIAKQLRKRIPRMLADANRLAAAAGPREHRHLQ